jgi:chromatin assembly factor 1 subunit A
MKIGAFFSKPKVPSTSPTCTLEDASSGVSSRRSSIASLDDAEIRDALSPSPKMKTTNPEYEKLFPPFFIHPNTELAPTNRVSSYKADPGVATALLNPRVADCWSNTAPDNSRRLQDTFKFRSHAKKSSRRLMSVRSIIDRIQGSSSAPIDLTGENHPLLLESLLDGVSLKVFSFHEDVRPGYHGTYTRPVSPRSRSSLRRRPSSRKLPDTDYDYDSEAEWEPPDEGDDDVDAIDEESGSEDDEEDMEDFLDDEGDVGKRRLIVGNLDPICSGLRWQGETEKLLAAATDINMKDFEIEIISGSLSLWLSNCFG